MSQRSPFPSHLRRRSRPSRGKTALSWVAWVGGASVLLYLLVLGDAGLLRVRHHEHRVAALEEDLRQTHQHQAELQGRTDQLSEPGSFMLESVARERYGLVKPGEKVLHVIGGSDEESPVAP